MKAILILNPTAGQRDASETHEDLAKAFGNYDLKCEIKRTLEAGEGESIARQAAEDGYDLIIAGGGDGTVNEVVNGIVGTDAAFGIIPLGTVNVLARELGIPLDIYKAVKVFVQGRTTSMDVGCANGRYFTLMAGFGFDAAVVANVVQPLKDMIGPSAYILKGLETLTRYKATDITLEMPEDVYTSKAFFVIVANASTYTYNLKITPHASPDDGMLDVCMFEKPIADRVGFMRQVAEIFMNRHLYHKAVRYFRATRVTVKSAPEVMVQLDGDPFGNTPVSIEVVPRALRVLVPDE